MSDDATSQGGRSLVFSLYNFYQYQQIRPGLLKAHKLHHRADKLRAYPTENRAQPAHSGNENLLWLLRSAPIEGLADLTDKQVQLTAPSDSAEMRRRYFLPAPAVIHYRDSTVQVPAAQPRRSSPTAVSPMASLNTCRLLYSLPFYATASGSRCWRADDPIAFALLYQKAAQKERASSAGLRSRSLLSTTSSGWFMNYDKHYESS